MNCISDGLRLFSPFQLYRVERPQPLQVKSSAPGVYHGVMGRPAPKTEKTSRLIDYVVSMADWDLTWYKSQCYDVEAHSCVAIAVDLLLLELQWRGAWVGEF